MNRYLLNISYIGSQFRGIQKTIVKAEEPKVDKTTVQGCIEYALQTLRPVNPVQVVLSSRTDSGVHALHSTVHVDLENAGGTPYLPLNITTTLNRRFYQEHFSIRVISTQLVSNTFHCRYNATGRTYLYRLATPKKQLKDNESFNVQKFTRFIPIEETYRCYFLQSDFNVEKFEDVARLFIGRHDFRSFMGTNKQDLRQNRAFFCVRTISDIKIEQTTPVTCAFNYENASQLYNYWNITITGRSFLYRQVRRIVATLVAAANEQISKKDVYEMLTIPSKNSWNSRITVIPPFGLYLCKVHYNEEDLIFPKENEEQKTMSFLNELLLKRSQLKTTETTVTYADGRKFVEGDKGIIQLKDKSCGFVIDNKPDKIPAVILDEGLLLGSQDSVDPANIQKYGITHILSIGIKFPETEECNVTFKYVPCLDLPETNLVSIIKESNEFITNALTNGKILVHCNAGVSRSAAVVIAFLITIKKLSFENAYQLVKSKRECIQPNVGFIQQLKNL